MKINEDARASTALPVQEETQSGDGLPSKIITVVEGIHNGLTRNFTYYPADKLEQSTESWGKPYNKPVIRNHNTWTEPTGRVMQSEFTKSIIDPEKFTIKLDLEITDPDTIAKVMDGRYQTLSIGGETNSCTCNICGKDILKEGFCGHWKGRTYEGKQCHWSVGEMTFDEISWVNVPADGNAQVIIKDASQKSKRSKESAKGRTTGVNENLLDNVDTLAEGAGTEETPAPEGQQAEGGTQENPTPETPAVKTVEELQVELDATIKRAEAAETQVTELTGQVTTLTERINELDAENKQQMAQNVELAKAVKHSLAESVVDMRVLLGKEKADERDSLVAEYAKSTAKLLNKQREELRTEKPVAIREQAPRIPSPGLAAHNDPHAQTEGEVTEGTSGKQEPGLKELEEAMMKAFNRQ